MSRLSPKKRQRSKHKLSSKDKKTTARLDPQKVLDAGDHKEIIINVNSLYSCHYETSEFINFLNKNIEKEFENYFYDFSSNSFKVNTYSYKDETDNIRTMLKEILDKQYNFTDEEINFMIKTRWIFDGQTTPLRLFFNLSENDKYELILIDPLHLAITSSLQREEKTYKLNVENKICISKVIKNIKSSYPMKNNILKDIQI